MFICNLNLYLINLTIKLFDINKTVRVPSDRMCILKKYEYDQDRSRTVQILIWSCTYSRSDVQFIRNIANTFEILL